MSLPHNPLSPEDAMHFVKATDKKMCGHNGFKFTLGQVYQHHGPVKCCDYGFHCCDTLGTIDRVCTYEQNGHTRYFIVKAWGHHDSSTTHAGGYKRAFEYMQLVTELKYKTLEEVLQSRAAIAAAFQGSMRDKNLADFDNLQAQFPSILKRHVKKLRTKTVVLADVNRAAIRKKGIAKNWRGSYCECPWILDKSQWKTYSGPCAKNKFDIYHCDREPAMAMRLRDAKAHVCSLPEFTQ